MHHSLERVLCSSNPNSFLHQPIGFINNKSTHLAMFRRRPGCQKLRIRAEEHRMIEIDTTIEGRPKTRRTNDYCMRTIHQEKRDREDRILPNALMKLYLVGTVRLGCTQPFDFLLEPLHLFFHVHCCWSRPCLSVFPANYPPLVLKIGPDRSAKLARPGLSLIYSVCRINQIVF